MIDGLFARMDRVNEAFAIARVAQTIDQNRERRHDAAVRRQSEVRSLVKIHGATAIVALGSYFVLACFAPALALAALAASRTSSPEKPTLSSMLTHAWSTNSTTQRTHTDAMNRDGTSKKREQGTQQRRHDSDSATKEPQGDSRMQGTERHSHIPRDKAHTHTGDTQAGARRGGNKTTPVSRT